MKLNRAAAVAAFAACALGSLGTATAAFAAAGDTPGTDTGATSKSTASQSATANASVVVDGSLTLALDTADKSFTLEGVAGSQGANSPDNSVSYIVTTNNITGYTVGLKADKANLTPADPTKNSDVIPFSNITQTSLAYAAGSVANGGSSTGSSSALDTTGKTIYSQTGRSDATGDEHKVTFAANIPFVNSGAYTGTVTFTASANA